MMCALPRPMIDGVPVARDYNEAKDTTDLDHCVGQLLNKGVMDLHYDRCTKVYLLPDDPSCHVLLMAGNLQTWAHAVVSPTFISYSPQSSFH